MTKNCKNKRIWRPSIPCSSRLKLSAHTPTTQFKCYNSLHPKLAKITNKMVEQHYFYPFFPKVENLERNEIFRIDKDEFWHQVDSQRWYMSPPSWLLWLSVVKTTKNSIPPTKASSMSTRLTDCISVEKQWNMSQHVCNICLVSALCRAKCKLKKP